MTTTQQVYAMFVRGYAGSTLEARFTFTASDDVAARRLASRWASYHGMTHYTDGVNNDRSDVVVRAADVRELSWPTNNEYLR